MLCFVVVNSADLLEPITYDRGVDRHAGGIVRAVGGALAAGGALGLAVTVQRRAVGDRVYPVAVLASAVAGAAGVASVRAPGETAAALRRFDRLGPTAAYVFSATSPVLSGGHASPAYFPAVVTTALGAGVSDDRAASRKAAAAVMAAWLAGCAKSYGAGPGGPRREMWWGPGAGLAFLGAAEVGSIAGDMVTLSRSLAFYADREASLLKTSGGRQAIEDAVREVRARGRRFRDLMPEVRAHFDDDPAIESATAEIASALASLESADLGLVDDRRALNLWDQLNALADRHNVRPGSATVEVVLDLRHRSGAPGRRRNRIPTPDAATTSAITLACVALIANSVNAARLGGRTTAHVTVSVGVERQRGRRWLVVTVADDAGGGPIAPSAWGKGLHDAADSVLRLGGERLEVDHNRAGVRVTMRVPYVHADRQAPLPTSLIGQAHQAAAQALSVLRATSAAQAAFILLAETPRERRPGAALKLAATLAAGEATERVLDGPARDRARAALAVAAMAAFPGAGRPPAGGWVAVTTAAVAAGGDSRLATAAAAIATAAAMVVAGPERFGAALPVTVGDRTFALVGLAGGHGIARGLSRIAAQESRVGSEAWLRLVLEDVTALGRDPHHFLKPLREALGDERRARFERTALWAEIEKIYSLDMQEAQELLEEHLAGGDSLLGLQRQLAALLAPATVHIRGDLPSRSSPSKGRELDPIRYRLGLIAVGDAVARRVRRRLPGGPLGRAALERLVLTVTPDTAESTRIEVVQVPTRAKAEDRDDAVLATACERAGGTAADAIGDAFAITVHPWALG